MAALVARVRPDVVFNATAWNRVDAAEREPEAAFAVNALAPRSLAVAARETGALLVHFSSDYVFDGCSARPYREDDVTRPLSVYGASKLAGELLVAASGARHLLVRTSGLIGRGGSQQKGGSFVDRILTQARSGQPLRVVADQRFAPTVAHDLALAAVALVRAGAPRALPRDERRRLQLARACDHGRCAGRPRRARRHRSRSPELALPAARPLFSVLDNARYLGLGLPPLRHWREALADCVR